MNRRHFINLSLLAAAGSVFRPPAFAQAIAGLEILPVPRPVVGRALYANPLASAADVRDFRMEGPGAVEFSDGRMRLTSAGKVTDGQAANFVYWLPQDFPDRILISWDFSPVTEPGLAMFFFAAQGRGGEDLFSPALSPRAGLYPQYNRGDINALHVAYFRRGQPRERAFNVCNLRKSHGFHLVASGADPLPAVADARPPYRISVMKDGPEVAFWIGELCVLRWRDDGASTGPMLSGGKIGFRQMVPFVADYANLQVYALA